MTIGAHLWVFNRSNWLSRPVELLARLGEGGYDGVEVMLPFAQETANLLPLPIWVIHCVPHDLGDLSLFLAQLRKLAIHDVCVSGPLQWEARSSEDFRETALFLNQAGRFLRDNGVFLHYHNHEFEFQQRPDGSCGMNDLLAFIDPGAVTLCLDLGWLALVGEDAPAWARRHAELIGWVHLRDFRGSTSVALGHGDLDVRSHCEVALQLPHVRRVVIEQDPTTEFPLENMLASREFLKRC